MRVGGSRSVCEGFNKHIRKRININVRWSGLICFLECDSAIVKIKLMEFVISTMQHLNNASLHYSTKRFFVREVTHSLKYSSTKSRTCDDLKYTLYGTLHDTTTCANFHFTLRNLFLYLIGSNIFFGKCIANKKRQ